MLYGEVHVTGKDLKAHIVRLLEDKAGIPEKKAQDLIEALLTSHKHISQEDFFNSLAEKNIESSKEELKNIFEILIEIGFLAELQFEGEEKRRYEPLYAREHHDHFICVQCKKIIEFTSRQLERMQDSMIFEKGCRPLYHKLEVYGICPHCQPLEKKEIAMTLVPEGRVVSVARLSGGTHFRKRLSDLGFVPKTLVKVVKNSHFGPLVIELKNSRLAIGRGEAQNIFVSEETSSAL